MKVFNDTPITFNDSRLSFVYAGLKDTLKWHNMSRKKYIPLLLSCINYYNKGVNSKKKV